MLLSESALHSTPLAGEPNALQITRIGKWLSRAFSRQLRRRFRDVSRCNVQQGTFSTCSLWCNRVAAVDRSRNKITRGIKKCQIKITIKEDQVQVRAVVQRAAAQRAAVRAAARNRAAVEARALPEIANLFLIIWRTDIRPILCLK